ncbi:MAG TPA: hypothetical protein VGF08_08215 [Terriglobales bacterium]|jgi:hypothetical protein
MITGILIGSAALILLLFLLLAIRGRHVRKFSLADLQTQIRPVDLIAFRNLMDPNEETYLLQNLPPSDFRKVQRARLRAALDYLRCLARNSALLMRVGEVARLSTDATLAQAGQELQENALRLRLYVFLAEVKVCLGIVMPGLRLAPANVWDGYERMGALLKRLGRIQNQGNRIPV